VTRTEQIEYNKARRVIGVILLYVGFLVLGTSWLTAIEKFLLTTFGFYYLLKTCAVYLDTEPLTRQFRRSPTTFLFFFFLWPGMNCKALSTNRQQVSYEKNKGNLYSGILGIIAGLIFTFLLSVAQPGVYLLSWLGFIPFILIFHFGLSKLLFYFSQVLGMRTKNPFPNPFSASSVADFWSRRWNLPFVEMNRCIFIPLCKIYISSSTLIFFVIFIVSGVLHEFAISYPVSAGYGKPLLYFVLQAIFAFMNKGKAFAPKLEPFLSILIVVMPLPLLFHDQFRMKFIVGFYELLFSI